MILHIVITQMITAGAFTAIKTSNFMLINTVSSNVYLCRQITHHLLFLILAGNSTEGT